MTKAIKQFLDGREGASDSDVDALQKKFGLSLDEAIEAYREWLNQLAPSGKV